MKSVNIDSFFSEMREALFPKIEQFEMQGTMPKDSEYIWSEIWDPVWDHVWNIMHGEKNLEKRIE